MNLKLVVAENCPACIRAQDTLLGLVNDQKSVYLQIQNIEDYKSNKLAIVPALFVNDDLYSYGDIDRKKFKKFLEAQ